MKVICLILILYLFEISTCSLVLLRQAQFTTIQDLLLLQFGKTQQIMVNKSLVYGADFHIISHKTKNQKLGNNSFFKLPIKALKNKLIEVNTINIQNTSF